MPCVKQSRRTFYPFSTSSFTAVVRVREIVAASLDGNPFARLPRYCRKPPVPAIICQNCDSFVDRHSGPPSSGIARDSVASPAKTRTSPLPEAKWPDKQRLGSFAGLHLTRALVPANAHRLEPPGSDATGAARGAGAAAGWECSVRGEHRMATSHRKYNNVVVPFATRCAHVTVTL